MPTLEDQRGKELVEKSIPHAPDSKTPSNDSSSPQSDPTQDEIESGIQSAENFANGDDDSAVSGGDSTPQTQTSTGSSSGSGRLQKIGGFAKRNKKKLGIGAGVGGFFAITIASFALLLPLKLASLVANITGKTFASVDNAIERREERIVVTYLAQRAGVQLGSGVVIENSPLSTLYANWAKRGFEKDLAAKGLSIVPSKDASGKVVRGRITVKFEGATRDFASLDSFMNSDLSSSDARLFIKNIVRDQTHGARWLRRLHMRRWLRKSAGIRRWSIFDRSTGKEATIHLDAATTAAVSEPTLERLPQDLTCSTEGETCPEDKDVRNEVDGTDSARPLPEPIPQTTAACEAGNKECNPADINTDPATSDVTAKAEADITAKADASAASSLVTKEIVKKIATVGTGLGALSLMADLDNALYHNTFGRLISVRRAAQYAALFSTWQTMDAQMRDGKTVSGDEVNATMLKLQDIQKSSAFSCLYESDCTKGTPLGGDSKVDSGGGVDTAGKISQDYMTYIGFALHPILATYRSTVGVIVKAITAVIGDVLSAITSRIPGISNATAWLGEKMGQLLFFILGTVADGTETNEKLANGMLAGADVTANGVERDTLGAPAVTDTSAMVTDSQINGINRAADRNKSMIARIFSTDSPDSVVMQLAAKMPSTTQDAVDQTGSYLASIVSRPAQIFSSLFFSSAFRPSHADTGSYIQLSGVQQYRYSDADLNSSFAAPTKDIAGPPDSDGKPTAPDGVINEYDCPVITDVNQPNLCLLDQAAIEVAEPSAGMTPDGGLNGSNNNPQGTGN